MVYVHRRSVFRSLSNEAEVYSALHAAVPHVVRVELDAMPLTVQMRMIASASSLVAVFGQALTWMFLLPPTIDNVGTTPRRESQSAIIELSPKDAFWKHDYQIFAGVLGLRYHRLYGATTGCVPQPTSKVPWKNKLAAFNKWLTCNLTIDPALVARTAAALG